MARRHVGAALLLQPWVQRRGEPPGFSSAPPCGSRGPCAAVRPPTAAEPGCCLLQAAEDAADDLEEVQQLRSQVVAQTGSLQHQRDVLAKYHRVLTLMETRFPISRASDHVQLSFAWCVQGGG